VNACPGGAAWHGIGIVVFEEDTFRGKHIEIRCLDLMTKCGQAFSPPLVRSNKEDVFHAGYHTLMMFDVV
jgi:hypothetical protein